MKDETACEPWLHAWYAVRPDIDPVGIAILGRIFRLSPAFESFRSGALAELGLTPEISDLIISLLRNGPPHELNSGALGSESTFPVTSSGAMTYRVESAERLGLVERKRDVRDRRGVIVSLTEKGRKIALRDVDLHMELVEAFLIDFSNEERAALANLMHKLVAGLTAS